MKIKNISLFTGGNLSLGRAGRATVTRTIEPKGDINILHADAFSDLRVIPGRTGRSAVTLHGMEVRAQRKGLAAELMHYARHGGTVQIHGRNYVLTEVLGNWITVKSSDGTFRRFDVNRVPIKFIFSAPPYVANPTPSIKVLLGNAAGEGELYLRASLDAASGEVLHQIVIADATDQKNIHAELMPLLSVVNRTNVKLTDMALSLRLNEPVPVARSSRLEAGPFDSAESRAPVHEAAASGVLTMPVADKITLQPGETKQINIATAVTGNLDPEADFVAVTLRQSLALGFSVAPGKVAGETSGKGNPSSNYVMSGTPAQQPAGTYEIYEGDTLAGSLFKADYTEKETEVRIPGSVMKAIEGKWTITTEAVQEGEWAPAIDTTGAPASSRRTEREERANIFSMFAAVDLSSKSSFDREVDLKIGVSSFDQGVANVSANANGEPLKSTYNQEEGMLTISDIPVPANGSTTVSITFNGKKTEVRNVATEASSRSPA